MTGVTPNFEETLRSLEAALDAPGVSQRLAQGGKLLIGRLKKPVRVGLFGKEQGDRQFLLAAILEEEFLPHGMEWPTIEIRYGETPRTSATLSDGTVLVEDGMPTRSTVSQATVLLQIELPANVLRRLSFLYLAPAESDAEESAFRWASRRTDISIWCTNGYSPEEAESWAKAPDELRNHSYLAVFGSEPAAQDVKQRAKSDFDGMIALRFSAVEHSSNLRPGSAAPLLNLINASVEEAIAEDLDAARVLIHRLGVRQNAATSEKVQSPRQDQTGSDASARNEMHLGNSIRLLSEPFLYLKRQTRNLYEALEWEDPEKDEWVSSVLNTCSETTSSLLDFALDWPEDHEDMTVLRTMVSEASELAVLLQVEGGEPQAEDAASILFQLRTEFENRLGAPTRPAN